ncbi:unnamed protein product, partial [Polarella glacialis]
MDKCTRATGRWLLLRSAQRPFSGQATTELGAIVEKLRYMKSPAQVLRFAVANEGSDPATLEAALRRLSMMVPAPGVEVSSRDVWTNERITSDGRFHVLLNALATRLEECSARTLAYTADAAARLQAPSPELMFLSERVAE